MFTTETEGNMPELEIGEITGGIGISSSIKNIGDADAVDIHWKISLDGGLILIGKETADTIAIISEGEETMIQSDFIFGFGKPSITIYAECNSDISDEKTVNAFVLLFFVLGVS
jgi:hypothetical protein